MTIAPDASDTPDLLAVLRTALAAGLGGVRVSIPAIVVSYSKATQTITAQVTIRSRYFDASRNDGKGDFVTYLPPPIAGIPVAFPSGGGVSFTWPLLPGDPVVLLVADRSIAEWKNSGANDNTPTEPRRFDLSDAIALPGTPSPAAPLSIGAVSDTDAVIALPPGAALDVGGATASQAVALSAIVDGVFGALRTWLDTHTHTSASPTSPTSPPIIPSPAPSSTASTRLKTDG